MTNFHRKKFQTTVMMTTHQLMMELITAKMKIMLSKNSLARKLLKGRVENQMCFSPGGNGGEIKNQLL
jgi:hypothetical protein